MLNADLDTHRKDRGYRRRLADAAGCHTSFISQVLNSPVHLTPDHGAGIARFWGLSEDETEYFLALVHLERSASKSFREFLAAKIARLREQNASLARRLKARREISEEHRVRYYSSWLYSAAHILLTIPSMGTSEAVASKLKIEASHARQILDTLAEMGLARRTEKGVWQATGSDVHVPGDSPLSVTNHCNWRGVAIHAIQNDPTKGLHYTAVHSLARADMQKLRDMITDFLRATREVVAPSTEEELVSLQIDFFAL